MIKDGYCFHDFSLGYSRMYNYFVQLFPQNNLYNLLFKLK